MEDWQDTCWRQWYTKTGGVNGIHENSRITFLKRGRIAMWDSINFGTIDGFLFGLFLFLSLHLLGSQQLIDTFCKWVFIFIMRINCLKQASASFRNFYFVSHMINPILNKPSWKTLRMCWQFWCQYSFSRIISKNKFYRKCNIWDSTEELKVEWCWKLRWYLSLWNQVLRPTIMVLV